MTTLDARCVYCRRKPVDPARTPFCSERCRMADLGRWLTGGYTVPGDPPPEDPDSDEAGERPGELRWPRR